METRYYLEAGHSLEAPKLALHASKKFYEHITNHLKRKEFLKKEIEESAKRKKYLQDGTTSLTANWENTVDNIREKNQHARDEKEHKKIDQGIKRYHEILKLQEERKKIYAKAVLERAFITRPPQNDLNKNLLLIDCLQSNAKQIELKRKMKEQLAKEMEEYGQKIRYDDDTFLKNESQKICQKRTAAENIKLFRQREIAEKRKREEDEKLLRIESEKIDIKKRNEEMERIQKYNEENYLIAKQKALKLLDDSRKEAAKKQRELEEEQMLFEASRKQIMNNRTEMNCKLKAMKKSEMEEKQKQQEAAGQHLLTLQKEKVIDQEKIIANVIAKQDQIENIKKIKKEENDKKAIQERKDDYNSAMDRKSKENIKMKEMQKWENMKNIKLLEVDEEARLKRKQNQRIKGKKFFEMLNEEMDEKRRILEEEKEKEASFKWNNFKELDEKFLSYGNGLIKQQKDLGNPTFPLEATIRAYKKRNGLMMPSQLRTFSSTVVKKKNDGVKLAIGNRRICPGKNDSSAVKDCICS